MIRTNNQIKNRDSDRILVLKPMEGGAKEHTSGSVDKRLFTGINRLHAIMDKETAFWYLRYDSGLLSEPLRQRFTSFTKLLTFVTEYFKRRNVEIKEVVD